MTDNNNEIMIIKDNLTPKTTVFQSYLKTLNLPSEDIIADTSQRETVMKNLPTLLSTISNEDKGNANYLSKFVAASAIGLFDAALNYIWNEVIVNLRTKINYYGLDTFYDNAVGNKRRSEYSNKDDLSGIKDKTLLDTCRKLEWISDIIYRKLCHILDMRNQIGASHPNVSVINAYELLGWLDVCVKDVINEKPSRSAIVAKKVIENIKELKDEIDDVTIQSLDISFKDLSTNTASALLVTLFGIYVSSDTPTIVRNNILLVSSKLWRYVLESTKYDLGTKKEFFKNNLEKDKEDLAYTFFEKCNGLNYLTLTEKSLTINNLCDDLYLTTHGWDNYYNEPPIAKEIMKYIKLSSDIPEEQASKLIKTFLECRIGREVIYCNGVSPSAKLYYDNFFKILSKEQIKILIALLQDNLQSINENNTIKIQHIKEILELIKSDLLWDRLNEIINYLIECAEKNIIHTAYNQKEFKDLCNGVIEIK